VIGRYQYVLTLIGKILCKTWENGGWCASDIALEPLAVQQYLSYCTCQLCSDESPQGWIILSNLSSYRPLTVVSPPQPTSKCIICFCIPRSVGVLGFRSLAWVLSAGPSLAMTCRSGFANGENSVLYYWACDTDIWKNSHRYSFLRWLSESQPIPRVYWKSYIVQGAFVLIVDSGDVKVTRPMDKDLRPV